MYCQCTNVQKLSINNLNIKPVFVVKRNDYFDVSATVGRKENDSINSRCIKGHKTKADLFYEDLCKV